MDRIMTAKPKTGLLIFITAYLLINTIYLCVLPFFDDLNKALLNGTLTPVTKLWAVNIWNFVGFGCFTMKGVLFYVPGLLRFAIPHNIIFSIVLAAHVMSIVGLLNWRKWVIRVFSYLLIITMVWGIFWPVIFDSAARRMEIYMFRNFNGRVWLHYWQPLKLMYCPECKTYESSQYEPIYLYISESTTGERFKAIDEAKKVINSSDLFTAFPDSYEKAKSQTEESFLRHPPVPINLAPAYWGIFRMTLEEYQSSRELYEFAMALIKALFYFWFVIIPGYFLFSINRKKFKSLFVKEVH